MERVRFIEVDAGVSYWEDSTLNGKEDVEGKMPFRNADIWKPIIELSTGKVLSWPEGNEASICYKVCDDGEYWLLDSDKQRLVKWKDYYVPDNILCVNANGYGDYIIFNIDSNGTIIGWQPPKLDPTEWEQV